MDSLKAQATNGLTTELKPCAFSSAIIHDAATVGAVWFDVRRDLQAGQFGHGLVSGIVFFIVRLNMCGLEQTREFGA